MTVHLSIVLFVPLVAALVATLLRGRSAAWLAVAGSGIVLA